MTAILKNRYDISRSYRKWLHLQHWLIWDNKIIVLISSKIIILVDYHLRNENVLFVIGVQFVVCNFLMENFFPLCGPPYELRILRMPISISDKVHVECVYTSLQCESKKVAPWSFLRYFRMWWTRVTKKYGGYYPNIFICLHQFWSIYLNICTNCIIFTSKTPQYFNNSFCLWRNSWIFH